MSTKAKTLKQSRTIQPDEVSEKIAELEKEKQRLIEEGEYIKADEIKQQIAKERANNKNMHHQNLSTDKVKQDEKLDEVYEEERNALILSWEEKLKKFSEDTENSLNQLEIDHKKAMEDFVEDQMGKYPKLKYSPTYLEGRKVEKALVKQERFKEADQYKKKCDKLEQDELEAYNNQRNISVQKKAEGLSKKQEMEKKVLKERTDRRLDLMKKQRDEEINKLDYKFKNLKKEIESAYKYESYAADKKLENSSLRGDAAMRRMNNLFDKEK